MSPRAVIAVYAAVMTGLIVTALARPGSPTAWAAVGVTAAAAIGVGTLRHRAARPWPWLVLAAAILASTCADVLFLTWVAGARADIGPANLLYLAAFVGMASALLHFARSGDRSVRTTGLLDAVAATVVLLLLVWVTTVSPAGYAAWSISTPLLLSYTIGGVLLLAMTVRLLTARRRTPAVALLVCAAVVGLVTDTAHSVVGSGPPAPWTTVLSAGWLLAYAGWGLAALQPTMTRLTAPEVLAERELTLRHLLVVGLIAVTPPVILLIEAATGEIRDGVVLALASAVLFLLGLARIAMTANGHRRSLLYRERHDTLTGLANRTYLLDRLASVLAARPDGPEGSVAVVLVDLDDFGSINDTESHSVGDEVLAAVARRLVRHLDRHDVAARFGGDEFAILIDCAPDRDIPALVSELAAAAAEPVTAAGRSIAITASLGLSIADGSDRELTASDLLRHADLALRAAKEIGPGQTCRYESERHGLIVERMRLREALAHAVEAGSFQLQYQPIVILETSETVGFEALVRWEHPTRGLVGPSEFIALAEETGLIDPIGDLVLRTAVADAVGWGRVSATDAYVSVNVSARQFRTPGFSERVERIVAAAGLPPALLTLEITESVLMREDDQVWAELATLRDNGIRLAIDDFGTGFSSLSYLEQTPIDVIKIDKSFVGNLVESGRQRTVVEGVVRMAEKLGLQIVAEGVELPEQRDLLVEMRCPYGQGYLYAVPLTNAEATNWLAYPPDPARPPTEGAFPRPRRPAEAPSVAPSVATAATAAATTSATTAESTTEQPGPESANPVG